ncbi:unnamed protein product, partial [Meganyctiphanes norvegica]
VTFSTMEKHLSKNPFVGLFGSLEAARTYIESHQTLHVDSKDIEGPSTSSGVIPHSAETIINNEQATSVRKSTAVKKSAKEYSPKQITELLESFLLISTHRDDHDSPRVLLTGCNSQLDLNSMPILLLGRCLLKNPENYLVGPTGTTIEREQAAQKNAVTYILHCYRRCDDLRRENSHLDSLLQKVVKSLLSSLSAMVENTEVHQRLILLGQQPGQILINALLQDLAREPYMNNLITDLGTHYTQHNKPCPAIFDQFVLQVAKTVMKYKLMTFDYQSMNIMDIFAQNSYFSQCLTRIHKAIDSEYDGKVYETTALGSLLTLSCLPQYANQPPDFFLKPSKLPTHTLKDTEASIWFAQRNIIDRIYHIFRTLLKTSPKSKHQLLSWIESCLETNTGREGLQNLQQNWSPNAKDKYVCDGFMINLGSVLLKLSVPFVTDPKSLKILKIDPRYCIVPSINSDNSGVPGAYTGDLNKQTFLKPRSDEVPPPSLPESFSFTSSCFFLTHRALYLGIQVIQQKWNILSENLKRIQEEKNDSNQERVEQAMENIKTMLYSYRAAIFEPSMMQDLFIFLTATCEWLVQMGLLCRSEDEDLNQIKMIGATLPDDKESHPFLQFIPEFIVETIIETIDSIWKFEPSFLETGSAVAGISHLLSFIVIFMGSEERLKNPHHRAKLARTLEQLLPDRGSRNTSKGLLSSGNCDLREQQFAVSQASQHLASVLISTFISIEVTSSGESVSFEQKFQYRRPMYEIIKYIWGWSEHRRYFKALSDEAMNKMNAATPPLFLRFVHILLNDATFLLNEGFDTMMQLRKLEKDRDNGEWNNLAPNEKLAKEKDMKKLVNHARYFNILGQLTFQTLELLTKEICEVFTHTTMVDRVSSMLNFILVHLVGPKQREIKVKEKKMYAFSPEEMVINICKIYLNLCDNEAFCSAVAADERSYTPELLNQAHHVLCRIGSEHLSQDILHVKSKVDAAKAYNEEEEEFIEEAPEEFLDPIMTILMRDPVTLPSSKVVCDRSTIAQHLLSDQTDPFTRQPLTMEDVEPNTELKNRVMTWLAEKQAQKLEE